MTEGKKGVFIPLKDTLAKDASHIKVPSKTLSVNGGSVIKTPPKPTPTGSKKEK